jgi:hypothetical protein
MDQRSDILMDPERMKQEIRAGLPGFAPSEVSIDDCEIVHVRYRTTERDERERKPFLSVCYRLDVRERPSGLRATQFLHAKAYPQGTSAGRFEKARRSVRARPRFGEAVAHLPRLHAVVWAFPNDPRLPHLAEVIDPEQVKQHLPYDRLPPLFSWIGAVGVDVVRYKPEVRCTTRYRLQTRVADVPSFVLYGKTFRHRRGGEILRRFVSLWERSLEGDAGFLLAEPLGYTEPARTIWHVELAGERPLDLIATERFEELIVEAARALAQLHSIDVPDLPLTTVADHLDRSHQRAATLTRAFPRLDGRLAALRSTLEKESASLGPPHESIVHGDFLLKQLVVHRGRLGILDFDNLARGDRIEDVANFMVDLHFQGLEPGRARGLASSFLRAYRRQTVTQGVPADRLRWHVRLQLLALGGFLFKRRHLLAGFESELEHILDLAEDPRRLLADEG